MTITVSAGVCMIALLIFALGFMGGVIVCKRKVDKHINCETCGHSKHGKYDANKANCAWCMTNGAFTGWKRRG